MTDKHSVSVEKLMELIADYGRSMLFASPPIGSVNPECKGKRESLEAALASVVSERDEAAQKCSEWKVSNEKLAAFVSKHTDEMNAKCESLRSENAELKARAWELEEAILITSLDLNVRDQQFQCRHCSILTDVIDHHMNGEFKHAPDCIIARLEKSRG